MVLVSHTTPGRFGIVAVMVFFILSGYWVTRMYAEKYARGTAPVATFYLSRFLRLWPAFALAILIAMAVRYVRGDVTGLNQLAVLPMLGVSSGIPDPLQISWSLDIEMQFYLLLPLLVGLVHLARSRMAVFLAVAGLTALGWAVAYTVHIHTALMFLPAFAAGMAIYFGATKVSLRGALISAGLFVVVGLLMLLNETTASVLIQGPMTRQVVRLASLGWALLLVPFVAWNVRRPAGRLDRHFGDYSYSLYLTHIPSIQAIGWLLDSQDPNEFMLIRQAAALAFALLFYLIVDRNLERMRLRILGWFTARLRRGAAGTP